MHKFVYKVRRLMRKFLRYLYVRLPRALRVWGNSIRAARQLKRLGKGRIISGSLGRRVYRGLGFKAAALAGVSLDEFSRLDAGLRSFYLEEAKKLIQPELYEDGPNTVTDAGVAALVDDWDNNTFDITSFNYHEMGTGGSPPSAPAVTATALVTPVESRSSGTKSQPAANQIRTVATITATAARVINEWGLFSAASAGTMWSNRWFTAITLGSGDGIEFTYTLTVSSFTA